MTVERLIEFRMLAQTLHYGRAAQKLYLSQSVLSRHIQDMEKELGAQLFQRGPHGVVLTPAGSYLYRESQMLIQQIDHATARVNSAGIGLAGSVRFGCLRASNCNAVIRFINTFSETYPNILLTPEMHNDLSADTDAQEAHYLFLPSTANVPPHFRLIKTFRERSAVILPASRPVRAGGTISLAELENETLYLPGPSMTGSYARARQMAERATNGRIRIVRVRNPETALMNVELGRGVALLPHHRMDEVAYKFHTLTVADAECYFELLFYQNEAAANDPAALLFGKEFCEQVQI